MSTNVQELAYGLMPGGGAALAWASTSRSSDETDTIAGMRMVVDVGTWSASRFVLAGGQSGNPLSPHYTDLFELWRQGEGVPMAWTEEEVRIAATQTLVLSPV